MTSGDASEASRWWLELVKWASIPLLSATFAAGGAWVAVREATADAHKALLLAHEVEADLSLHTKTNGHETMSIRVTSLEEDIRTLRAAVVDNGRGIQSNGLNIAAICQATEARCR